MKKTSILFLTVLMILAAVMNIFAAEGVIKDGRTFVPVRGVFETLGFSVNWDPEANKATMSDGKHDVSVIKGMNYFKADGKQIYPDVAQQVINNGLYLPLRAVGDAIGANVSWDSGAKTAHISYDGKDVYVKCKEIKTPAKNTAPANKNTASVSKNTAASSGSGQTYILNTNTKRFHRPGCSSVSDINEKNKSTYTGSREEVIKMGYSPCKRCNP